MAVNGINASKVAQNNPNRINDSGRNGQQNVAQGNFNPGSNNSLQAILTQLISLIQQLIAQQQGGGNGGEIVPHQPAQPAGADIKEVGRDQFNATNTQQRPVGIDQTVSLSPAASQNFTDSGLKGTHVISSQQQLEAVAQQMGVPATQLPQVDFSKQALVFNTQDQADPNRLFAGGLRVDDQGVFDVGFASTRMGFQASGNLDVHFSVIDRQGLTSLTTSNPNNSNLLGGA